MPPMRLLSHYKIDAHRDRLLILSCNAEDMLLPRSNFTFYGNNNPFIYFQIIIYQIGNQTCFVDHFLIKVNVVTIRSVENRWYKINQHLFAFCFLFWAGPSGPQTTALQSGTRATGRNGSQHCTPVECCSRIQPLRSLLRGQCCNHLLFFFLVYNNLSSLRICVRKVSSDFTFDQRLNSLVTWCCSTTYFSLCV